MREIKFRVWDKKSKKYRALNTISFNYESEYGNFNSDRLPKLVCLWGKSCIEQKDIVCQREIKDVIIEQFTGLYDKNGKEIYEGDILTDPRYEEPFIVEYSPNVAGYVGWGDDRICGCYLITEEDIEIVGNIHENPELLEGVR